MSAKARSGAPDAAGLPPFAPRNLSGATGARRSLGEGGKACTTPLRKTQYL